MNYSCYIDNSCYSEYLQYYYSYPTLVEYRHVTIGISTIWIRDLEQEHVYIVLNSTKCDHGCVMECNHVSRKRGSVSSLPILVSPSYGMCISCRPWLRRWLTTRGNAWLSRIKTLDSGPSNHLSVARKYKPVLHRWHFMKAWDGQNVFLGFKTSLEVFSIRSTGCRIYLWSHRLENWKLEPRNYHTDNLHRLRFGHPCNWIPVTFVLLPGWPMAFKSLSVLSSEDTLFQLSKSWIKILLASLNLSRM